jgi:hypothetical protein
MTNKFSSTRADAHTQGDLRKTKSVPAIQHHKAGDTWSTLGYATVIELETGNMADLTGWIVESQMRDFNGELIAQFDCTLTDPIKQVFTHIAPDTSNWPPGVAFIDVRFKSPEGQVISTDTQSIVIERGVTA